MSIRTTFVTVSACIAVLAYAIGIASVWMLPGSFVHGLVWFVAVACAVGLAALMMGYRFAQVFRRRLYDIEEAAALMAGGRLHHRVAHAGERDEIDCLASQFNQMGEKLEQQVTLLQRLAEENRRLAADAERAATMDERQRLARDLHDSVSQQLFALTMMAETALRHAASNSPQLTGTLDTIADLANRAQREMRALLLHLRPVELAGRSLQEAASSFLQAVQERHGLVCTFTCEIDEAMPPLVEENLFRILQEAVANVLKHAEAGEIRVHLQMQAAGYEMSVTDDGVGLPAADVADLSDEAASAAPAVADSYGIVAMRERAESLGGRFTLLPRKHGTIVNVTIPKTGECE